MLVWRLICAFRDGWKENGRICEEKELRSNMSEPQIDRMIRDSFPASDPPSTY